MGTSVGSKAITLRQAVLIAGIFEFAGAVLIGIHVTKTIQHGILDPALFSTDSIKSFLSFLITNDNVIFFIIFFFN